jgi:DNA polymerase III subunit alpha
MEDTLNNYFIWKCKKGLKARGLDKKKEYQERLAYELKVIQDMDYCGYFLVVSDFLGWARDNGILVNIGRGSSAGSLCCYCLYITHIDPIKWGLYFERMLNPGRKSMPDVDSDLPDNGRDRVIEYVVNKYGKDKVCHIGTFGSMKAKGSIRAAARVLDQYEIGDSLSKKIFSQIHGKPVPLSASIELIPELQAMLKSKSPEADILFWAQKLEGLLTSIGQHAAGVIVADEPLVEIVPLFVSKKKDIATQWEMNNVEQIGLVKFDFLGLKTLDKIQICLNLIKRRYNKSIDIYNLPDKDEKVFNNLCQGDTVGIFQLEGSNNLRDLVVKTRPKNISDISLVSALCRPGPLANLDLEKYSKIREGVEEPEYLVPELKPILKESSGILIFQESLLRIAKELCGFTLSEADSLRKAVGKKIQSEMLKNEERFINGWEAHGLSRKKGEELWSQIVDFADYSFNLAHSASYATLSYITAYLKTYYPLEFMTSVLTIDRDNIDQTIRYLSECKRLGIDVTPPDINRSGKFFDIVGDKILFGLGPIKNLGESPVDLIVEEREKNGLFTSFQDFLKRLDLSVVNKKKVDCLVKAGAFDQFSVNRASLAGYIEPYWDYRKEYDSYLSKLETFNKKTIACAQRLKEIEDNKLDLFPAVKGLKPFKVPTKPEEPQPPELKLIDEMEEQELLKWEHELLGYYVTSHPMEHFKTSLEKQALLNISQLKQLEENGPAVFGAVITEVKQITTAKKKLMAYLQLEDQSGQIEAVVFPRAYEKFVSLLEVGKVIKVEGLLEVTEGETKDGEEIFVYKIIANGISELIHLKSKVPETVEITLKADIIERLLPVIKKYQGQENKLRLILELQDKTKLIFQKPFMINKNKVSLFKEITETILKQAEERKPI